MKLKTINTWLRRIGLVLVMEVDWDSRCREIYPSPTKLWVETATSYDRRSQKYERTWEEYDGLRPTQHLNME